ncbi:MAG: glycosyl transferase [Pseudoxanthomonas sp.]|nr:glycosyl transferase [Pseudoxanthomonas sp.]
MTLAAWLVLHALVSGVMTWLALVYARRRNLVDLPGERRSHSVPTPRGGGLGITCALLAGYLVATAVSAVPAGKVACIAGGLVLVAGIGWIDDHRPLSAWVRLAVQCLAGVLLAWGMHGADGRWGWALLTAGLVPVLVNVWNFMDGINGLATTQATLVALGFAWLAPGIAYAALALAVAAAAFLPFNFPRARIFLGDVGSGTLGYALATLGSAAAAELAWSATLLLLPLSAFLIDASLTLGRRILAGERWWQPHTSHLYQVCVKAGFGHSSVTAVYLLFSLLAIILAFAFSGASPGLAGTATFVWFACAIASWFWLRGRFTLGNGNT